MQIKKTASKNSKSKQKELSGDNSSVLLPISKIKNKAINVEGIQNPGSPGFIKISVKSRQNSVDLMEPLKTQSSPPKILEIVNPTSRKLSKQSLFNKIQSPVGSAASNDRPISEYLVTEEESAAEKASVSPKKFKLKTIATKAVFQDQT